MLLARRGLSADYKVQGRSSDHQSLWNGLRSTGLLKRYICPVETWRFPPQERDTTIYKALIKFRHSSGAAPETLLHASGRPKPVPDFLQGFLGLFHDANQALQIHGRVPFSGAMVGLAIRYLGPRQRIVAPTDQHRSGPRAQLEVCPVACHVGMWVCAIKPHFLSSLTSYFLGLGHFGGLGKKVGLLFLASPFRK